MTSSSTVTLHINGDAIDVATQNPSSLQLTQLLSHLDIEGARGVAIAVNDEVVPRSKWEGHTLHPNDRVEIIRATQGG